MADKAYPTSEPGQRQLSSMSPEEKARYDAALKARQEEAGRESIGSVKRRYGLGSKEVPVTYVPQPVEGEPTTTMSETKATQDMSTELAQRYKQYHSAPEGPMKEYFAKEITALEEQIGSVTPSFSSQGMKFSGLSRHIGEGPMSRQLAELGLLPSGKPD